MDAIYYLVQGKRKMTEHATFQCAVKVLLKNNNALLVLYTPNGYIDFPGGRISEGEETIPFTEVVKRELAEELGNMLQYSVGNLAFVTKRFYTFNNQDHHIVALYYEATLESGTIQLSEEHSEFKWHSLTEIKQLPKQKFVTEDEYNQLQQYLS